MPQQDLHIAGLPVRAALHPTGMYLAVRNIRPEELQDAFMQETVARSSAADVVVQVANDDLGIEAPDTAPAGLIFHVARCGSTLVSQSLKQIDGPVVYAEPQSLNELLLPPHNQPRPRLVAALRSLGAAFARHARKPYVLKLTSWNTLYCDLLVEAFPATPWVLTLRDPAEVGVSLLARPPGWFGEATEAARQLSAAVDPEGNARSREEFIAQLYGAFCAAAGRLDARLGRLVWYESLPAAVWEVVAPHFALSVDAAKQAVIAHTALSDAKSPIGKPAGFVPDAAVKQAAASVELRRAIDAWARPLLERLVSLHTR